MLLTPIIILAVIVGIGGVYTIGLMPVEPGNTDPVTVEVPSGSGASAIVDLLDEAGLVKSRFWAKVNSRLGHYNNLQANVYIFNKDMTFNRMMTAINEGDFEYVSKENVEVKDGARLEQVAEAMAEELPFTKKEILAKWTDKEYIKTLIDKYWFLSDDILDKDIKYPLEGYLYADTYFVTSENSTIEGFTEMCLDRMETELDSRKEEIEASKLSLHEILTLTSIVTKEATADDQPGVAGVFMNRLDKGMSLGSDVTVCYIYQEDRVDLKQSQLDNDSPYNTRKFEGLPPGPICQVVGSAIDATLNYDKSDYLYFVADENGVVHFNKDEAGHESDIKDYGLLKDDEETE